MSDNRDIAKKMNGMTKLRRDVKCWSGGILNALKKTLQHCYTVCVLCKRTY